MEAEVAGWLERGEAADASEDKLPSGATRAAKKCRIGSPTSSGAPRRSAQAKAELEAEARAAAEAKLKAQAEAEKKREAEGRKKPGRPAAPPSEAPDPKAQKNFTDPESRIMKTKDGFIQGYNAQAAVDAEAQMIVAHGLDAKRERPASTDADGRRGRSQHWPQTGAGLGRCRLLLGRQSRGLEQRKHRRLCRRPGQTRQASDRPGRRRQRRVAAMREKIKAGGHQSPYRLRKQLPEPVFGQIKQARGFRQFLLRGIEKVRAEWALVCPAHNLCKLAHSRSLSTAMPQATGAA